MPNPTYGTDGLLATTIAHYIPQLADNIFGMRVLLWILKTAGRIKNFTGTHIVQPLMYAPSPNIGSYADDDPFSTDPNTGLSAAEFPFRQYFGNVGFTGIELAKNSGREAILSLLEARLTQLELSMAADLNTMLYADGSGNTNKDFYGLAAIVSDADPSWGDLGGIDRTVAGGAYWRANMIDGQAAPLGLGLMRTAYNTPSEGNDQPTNIITDQIEFEAYESLLEDTVRHESTVMGDAGFQNLMFKGAPVAFDRDVPAGLMYFLNVKYLTLAKLNNVWFQVSDWLKPVDADVQFKNILLYGNLVVSNCARQAAIFDLDETPTP